MKYFNIQSINRAITCIREGNNTQEHVTGRAGTSMAIHYFPIKEFAITPEQIQQYTKKKPDLAIEKYTDDSFIPHCYIEFKSLIGKSINAIPDQLFETLFVAIDDLGMSTGQFSVFMVAMKGTKIAFYMYHSYASLLDEYGIPNYKGFIPINYLISREKYYNYCSNNLSPLREIIYNRYIQKMSNITTDANQLRSKGALETNGIEHPHVMDLVRDSHKDDIHNMWQFIADNVATTVLL